MLDQTIQYLNNTTTDFEIIIVNDGSKDSTWDLIQRLINNKYSKFEMIGINYEKNSGKGFAVRTVINK